MKIKKLLEVLVILNFAALAQLASAQTLPSVTDAMNNIFQLAESKLGDYFPPGAQTQFFQDYVYRYYEPTGTYLAFADGNVLVLGGVFGDTVQSPGSIPSVESLLESYQAPEVSERWNLDISGTVLYLGQAIDFDDILLEDVVAPDITNNDDLASFMNANLDDLPVDGNSISAVVISNTESQRIVDVDFVLSIDGITAGYELRLVFTRQ